MTIPREFTIHGHKIKVIFKDIDKQHNQYGYYDTAKEEIVLFKKLISNGEEVELADIQIQATFWHELIHVLQWHMKCEIDEVEAQTYAGMLLEFFQTSQIKILPTTIKEPIEQEEYEL